MSSLYDVVFDKNIRRIEDLGGLQRMDMQSLDFQVLTCMNDTKDETWEFQGRGGLLTIMERNQLPVRMAVQDLGEEMRHAWVEMAGMRRRY